MASAQQGKNHHSAFSSARLHRRCYILCYVLHTFPFSVSLSFPSSLLLRLLLFPASWLSLGSSGWMTNEMEVTGDGGIKERADGPLLTLRPSSNSKCINSGNESALHRLENIPQLFCCLRLCPETAVLRARRIPPEFPQSHPNNQGQAMV